MDQLRPEALKAKFDEHCRQRSFLKGVAIFVTGAILFVMCVVGIATASSIYAMVIWAILKGLSVGLLFIIGHDACHSALTPNRFINHLLARLAFLPSLTPFTAWELGHNRLHHGWTNLKGKDYVWTPYSVAEFHCLSATRRKLEQIYRTPLGVGLYALIEIWWKHMIHPRSTDREKMNRVDYHSDRLLVLVFLGVDYSGMVLASPGAMTPLVLITFFIWGIVVPLLIWNWMFGFLIFMHHTHPKICWYDKQDEWSFYLGQVQGTVHIVFPRIIGILLHHIMEHTAHHVDPRIPLYELAQCQSRLEESLSDAVIVERWSIKYFMKLLSSCQLYDYENKQWLTFEGH